MPDAAGAPPAQPPGAAPVSGGPPTPAWTVLQDLLRELPGLVSDRIELFSLEMQRAARALAQIVMLLVAAAIVGVTAWLTLWAAIALGLVALGLPGPWALLLVLAVNAAAVYAALARVRRLARLLQLPATRRHLTRPAPAAPEPPAAPTTAPLSETP